jgi:hypothetical protein
MTRIGVRDRMTGRVGSIVFSIEGIDLSRAGSATQPPGAITFRSILEDVESARIAEVAHHSGNA